jgi:uncharacterized protein (TIGR02147 family)
MKSIFLFKDYKKYLLDFLENQPQRGRGLRGKWAEAAGCQLAYVSHVLGGPPHFSLEQAESISRFVGHSQEETEYFLLLVEKARAGTASLKQFFQHLIEAKLEYYHNLRNRMKIQASLKLEDQAIYYSRWHYAAIHMILTIPEYQTAVAISEYFSMPLVKVKEYLSFLVTRHLAEEATSGRYSVKEQFLHIGKESPLFPHQQVTWRHKAIESIYNKDANAIHFASCFSLSARDIAKIKDILGQTIEDTTEVIKPSKEEKLFSICLDFFELR